MKNQKGSFMVESIVAISLVVVGLLGVLSLLVRSVGLNQNSYNRFIAASLAAEGIEIVKNIIDTDSAKNSPWGTSISNGVYELVYNCISLVCGKNWPLSEIDERFFDNLASPLRFDNGIYNYAAGTSTVFKRLVRVENVPAEAKIKVNSLVQWDTRGLKTMINVEDHFYNWRP